MIPFIYKEIRQNGLWTLIAAVLMSIVFVFVLNMNQSQSQSLVDQNMMLTQGLLFGNGGLALGIAIILSDTYRGRWGFIVTRPISRTQIFLVKLIAGSILYFLATSLAIVKATIFAMNMRFTMAPFAWDMVIPSIYIQFVGWSGLVAGMLVGSRRASWIGSRLFPAAAMFVGNMIIISALIYFGESVLLLIVITVLFIFAALYYFIHNGEYEPQSIWIKPVQFIIIAAGSAMLVALGCGIVYAIHSLFVEPTTFQYGSQYTFTKDGSAYLLKYSRSLQPEYYDLSQKPLTKEQSLQIDNDRMVMGYHYWYDENDPRLPRAIRMNHERFINGRRYLHNLFVDRGGDKWIYVAQKRIIQGIDNKGNSIGAFGADGWHANAAEAPPLNGQLRENIYRGVVYTDRDVFTINPTKRTINYLYRAPADETIKSATGFASNSDSKKNDPISHEPYQPFELDLGLASSSIEYITVATDKNLKILSSKGIVLSFDYQRYNRHHVNVGGGKDGIFYLHFGPDYADRNSTDLLLKINSAGEVLTKTELPQFADSRNQRERDADYIPMTSIPSAMMLIAWLVDDEVTFVKNEMIVFGISLVIVVMLMVLLIKRYQLTKNQSIIWLIASVAFGITAVLTLIFLRNRPAMITCPSCGNKREISGNICPNCAKSLSPPSDPEIEIFDLPLKIA